MATSGYGISVEQGQELAIYQLHDHAAQATVGVVPDYGHNAISFRTAWEGTPCDLLAGPPKLAELRAQPSHWGNPVLFPFPNRIRGGVFTFQGRQVDLHDQSSRGNAIHGLLMRRAWRVARHDADSANAWIEAVASTADLPDLLEVWPFPFAFHLTYRLTRGTLRVEALAQNIGDSAMPMGFGIHPYFPAPFLPGSTPADCAALVPAAQRWVMDDEIIPTGERRPVDAERDLRHFRPVDQVKFDDVLTDLTTVDGWSTCLLRDRRAGVELFVRSDAHFREMVVYTPPRRAAICFEPYSCATDAFNLAARGRDAGMVVLEPGQTWTGTVEIGLRPARD